MMIHRQPETKEPVRENITYKDLSNGDVEVCRALCDELMRHQAGVGLKYREILAAMNFDNRLKPSFNEAAIRRLLVAFDGETPVGYIFACVADISEDAKYGPPPFSESMKKEDASGLGFIPIWLKCPASVGEIVNLYVKREYRKLHIGGALMDEAMTWLRSYETAEHVLVYVSNGNDPAAFYAKYGFTFSHDVLNGFIKCYSANMARAASKQAATAC